MRALLADLRFGFRLLRRNPAFAGVAVLVLSLGIGVNTAAFSVVNTLLLKPRVGNIDGELAGVYSRHRQQGDDYRAFSWADYLALRDRHDLFRSLTAHNFGMAGLKEGAVTRRVFADVVTANYFETFGVTLPLGRTFTAAEEQPGADIPVVILSHNVWTRMGASADVLGREVEINLRPYTVVGVAPRGFGGSMVLATPELWVPTGVYESMAAVAQGDRRAKLADPNLRELIVVARLPQGVGIDATSRALAALADQLSSADPASHRDHTLEAAPLSRIAVSTRPQVDDELVSIAGMLVSLASLVLVIAAFNLANMLLARGQARQKELAVRLAVGGSRWRIVRQLLAENLVLAAFGGVGGILLSLWATRYVLATMPPVLPIALSFDTSPDLRVLAAAVAFSVAASLLSGLGPAWSMVRADLSSALKDHAGDRGGRRSRWLSALNTRDALVMGQVAMTFVMLTAAGLFVRGALDAAQADPGFTLDRGLMINVDTALAGYDRAKSLAYYGEAVATLRRTAGVEAAGLASHMPFGEFQTQVSVQLPGPSVGRDDPERRSRVAGATNVGISADYFAAMGIGLLRGRDFTDLEAFAAGATPVAIIDETLARRLFADRDPVGQAVQTAQDGVPTVHQVVAVVAGVRSDLFATAPEPFIYFPLAQHYASNVYLHGRTSAATADAESTLLGSAGRAVAAVDPGLPFVALETRAMFRERNLMLALLRTGAWLFAGFGAGALLLAGVGLYGVKSYLVSRRTREIGIRLALGATGRSVVGMVLREGLLLAAIGLVLGAGLSVATGTAVRSWLFQGRALDLPVIALTAVTMLTAMMLACWVPARRAINVQPASALRAQ